MLCSGTTRQHTVLYGHCDYGSDCVPCAAVDVQEQKFALSKLLPHQGNLTLNHDTLLLFVVVTLRCRQWCSMAAYKWPLPC